MKWISAIERLPEQDAYCIVGNKHRAYIYLALFNVRGQYWMLDDYYRKGCEFPLAVDYWIEVNLPPHEE